MNIIPMSDYRPIFNFPIRQNVEWNQIRDHCPHHCTLRIPGGAFAVRTDIDTEEALEIALPHLLFLNENRTDIDFIYVMDLDDDVEEALATVNMLRSRGLTISAIQLHNEQWLPRYEKSVEQAASHEKDKLFVSETMQQMTPEKYVDLCMTTVVTIETSAPSIWNYILNSPFPNFTNSTGQYNRLHEWTDRMYARLAEHMGQSNFRKRIRLSIHPYVDAQTISMDSVLDLLAHHGLEDIGLWTTEHALPESTAERMMKAGQYDELVNKQTTLWGDHAMKRRPQDRWGCHSLYQREGWGLISEDGPTPFMDALYNSIWPILGGIPEEEPEPCDCSVEYVGHPWVRISTFRWSRRHTYMVTKAGSTETHHRKKKVADPMAEFCPECEEG